MKDPHQILRNELRSSVYRGIRRVVEQSTRHVPRAVVVQVLAAMAAEQAGIVVRDAHSDAG